MQDLFASTKNDQCLLEHRDGAQPRSRAASALTDLLSAPLAPSRRERFGGSSSRSSSAAASAVPGSPRVRHPCRSISVADGRDALGHQGIAASRVCDPRARKSYDACGSLPRFAERHVRAFGRRSASGRARRRTALTSIRPATHAGRQPSPPPGACCFLEDRKRSPPARAKAGGCSLSSPRHQCWKPVGHPMRSRGVVTRSRRFGMPNNGEMRGRARCAASSTREGGKRCMESESKVLVRL